MQSLFTTQPPESLFLILRQGIVSIQFFQGQVLKTKYNFLLLKRCFLFISLTKITRFTQTYTLLSESLFKKIQYKELNCIKLPVNLIFTISIFFIARNSKNYDFLAVIFRTSKGRI